MPNEIKVLNMQLVNKLLQRDFKDFTSDEKALMLKFASHQKLEIEEQQKLIEMGFNTDYEL